MRRLYIGNQTTYFVPPLLPFTFAMEHGFEAFEFFPDGKAGGPGWVSRDLNEETRQQIRAAAQEHGIRLSVHASLGATPGSDTFWEDVAFGQDIGASVLNTHMPRDGWADFVPAVAQAARRLRAVGMSLALENTVATSPEEFERLFTELRALDADGAAAVGMCLDIGHANLHVDTRNEFLAYVDRLPQNVPIIHIHAHENWGDSDSHLPLYTGPAREDDRALAGLVQRLDRRDFCGSIILEQWPTPPELLVDARNRLHELNGQLNDRCGEAP
jgi:sugar phosphate isomerase/epimerase